MGKSNKKGITVPILAILSMPLFFVFWAKVFGLDLVSWAEAITSGILGAVCVILGGWRLNVLARNKGKRINWLKMRIENDED